MRSNTEFELKSSELDRISFLAQPKQSEMVWFTRPWMLTWGNQESIRPLSHSALRAIPSHRIKALAQHKKDFSCHQTERGKEEEGRMMKKMLHPSHTLQYEHIIRLATPKPRGRISQEVGSPHSELCEYKCPIWHVKPCVRNISKRLLQLALPKSNHPNFTSDRQSIQTFISCSAKTAKMTPRLEQLSLPKLRENRHFYDLGEPESPIRPVSREARNAIASARVRSLSSPKPLSKDYIHPKEPAWRT
ncbi:sperm microtubule associated protein 2-like [Paramisgurnus dabryanus]|uniref:sperm microtubule associated protein 2-like n=1 Tax=Paramisgurnus dabryanus TaxID=90735 RepID=UPI003CCF88DE